MPQGELRLHLSMGPAGSSGREFRPGRGLQGLRKAGGGPMSLLENYNLLKQELLMGKPTQGGRRLC